VPKMATNRIQSSPSARGTRVPVTFLGFVSFVLNPRISCLVALKIYALSVLC